MLKNKDEYLRIFQKEYGKNIDCKDCKNLQCKFKEIAYGTLIRQLANLTIEFNEKMRQTCGVPDDKNFPVFIARMIYCPKKQ